MDQTSQTEERTSKLLTADSVIAAARMLGKPRPPEERQMRREQSPALAIRRYCLVCHAESRRGVRECAATTCPLWRFRFGVRPATAVRRGLPVDPAIPPPEPVEALNR